MSPLMEQVRREPRRGGFRAAGGNTARATGQSPFIKGSPKVTPHAPFLRKHVDVMELFRQQLQKHQENQGEAVLKHQEKVGHGLPSPYSHPHRPHLRSGFAPQPGPYKLGW